MSQSVAHAHYPDDENQLSAMVGDAARNAASISIVGGGTRAGFGASLKSGMQLFTSKLTGITLYEPSALTIAARAGTPLAQIEAELNAQGQHLPFEPANWRALMATNGEPTIGGMVASNACGPRRIHSGAVRDSAIGVRFVDGAGTLVKNGGRVMKNVTGYDLVKLMCGSFGTLGVLTEVTFKLLPRPETSATVILAGLSQQQGVAAMSAGLTSPWDVTGAAHTINGATARTFIRVEGFESSVAYRAGRLQQLLSSIGNCSIEASHSASIEIWRSVRDVEQFAGKDGAVWRVCLRPSSAPAFLSLLGRNTAHQCLLDWGGGLVWLLLPEQGDAGQAAVRSALAGFGGHATLVRAAAQIGEPVDAFQPQTAALAAISAALRRQFDPKGIFNRDRMRFNAGRGT